MTSQPGVAPPLAVALARGDNFVASTMSSPVTMTTAPEIRGDSWLECSVWYQSMPGSFFQCFCVFLCLAFMGSGHTSVAALYTHVLSACAFFFLAIWGIIDSCATDVIAWGLVIFAINVGQVSGCVFASLTCSPALVLPQICYISFKEKQTRQIFDSVMQTIYNMRFAPFEITPQVFVDLVTCKVFPIILRL